MKEITQNELNSPEAPGDGWYIIEASGQHPHGEIMQNLTPAVLARVAAAGVPDLSLVRAFSEGGKRPKKPGALLW